MSRLNEVDVIRPISITLVILTHCFAIYTGAWKNPNPNLVPIVNEYKILNQILISFRMPAVILVAGYIYAYFYEKKNNEKIRDVIKSKFKRLIIPSLIFSCLYMLCFPENLTIKNNLLKITSGIAHFWFLPMLFWNFIIGYYLVRLKINYLLILLTLFIIGIASSVMPNYFGLSIGLKFSPFFYIGIILMKKRNKVFEILNNRLILFLIFIIYILVLFFKIEFEDQISFNKQTIFLYNNVLDYLLKSLGVFCFYLLVMFLIKEKIITKFKIFSDLSKKMFGMYVFHQFIIKFFIDYILIYQYLNYKTLPWILFLITTILSWILTTLFLKTKTGKYLLG